MNLIRLAGIIVVFFNSLAGIAMGETTASPSILLSSLEQHKPIYLLQTWFLNQEGSKQGFQNQETLIQFSFKKLLFKRLYFGYTQKMFWQTGDLENSRPFREQNYSPELFLEFRDQISLDLVRLGLTEHESNGDRQHYDQEGKEVNDSRTWDRTYLYLIKQITKQFQLGLKFWVVTSPKTEEYSSYFDDNPDMQQYLGSGEVHLRLKFNSAELAAMLRRGWREKTETVQLDFRTPLALFWGDHDSGTDLHSQYFSGYGNSLVDYNRKITRWALGFSFR